MFRTIIDCSAGSLCVHPTLIEHLILPSRQRNDGPYYRPVQQPAQSQYRPQIAAPGGLPSNSINGSPADEGILSTLSNGFNSLVNNIFG
ncbi:AAEL011015-PA [Aedes aegypti]|uniref:AAEL011015-PA n=1 Tax=Aedes aegypti TaxID=7159 RepID=Q16RA5_AEDAE|nr:AAEL011015-PA [Aedes aegypti]